MNKERRKRLAKVLEALHGAKDELEKLQEEEQEALENMPESLQDTERGQNMEADAGQIGDASGNVEDAIDSLENMSDGG